jgi:hypothetical protein
VWGLEIFFFLNLKKIEEKLIKCFTIFKLYFVYSIQKVKKRLPKMGKHYFVKAFTTVKLYLTCSIQKTNTKPPKKPIQKIIKK